MKQFVMAAAAVAFAVFAAPSHATRHKAHRRGLAPAVITCNLRGCSDWRSAARLQAGEQRFRGREARYSPPSRRSAPRASLRALDANGNDVRTVVLGGRPSGCPHAFCGCEASLYVFGHTRRGLNLAYNWVREFPRASPAPGMAAARWGHVMVLIRHVAGKNWLVHDGNSGGHLTREHVRSIAGYVIVDPHGSRRAEW